MQPRVLDATADGDAIRLRWSVGESNDACSIERSEGDGAWASIGNMVPDGLGVFEYTDRAIVPGFEYIYRLRVPTRDGELLTEPVAVTAGEGRPSALSLRAIRPNPSFGAFRVSFDAAGSGPVRLDLVDLAGRRVHTADGRIVGPGRQELSIEPGRLAAGIYFLRLRHGGAEAVTRIVRLAH